MNQTPLVSICIPTYNGRKHLKDCLESVQSQSFKDFEVVICDDQSSDGTLDYARELAKEDDRFRFIENDRRYGLPANWNRCVSVSRGDWIKFVFQDDLLLPACLDRMLTVAEREDSRFLSCRRDFQFEETTTPEVRTFYTAHAASIDRFFSQSKTCHPDDFANAILESISMNLVGEPTTMLIHRQMFERFGLFNENLLMCCDSEFSYRVGTHVPVTHIPETLVIFRVHGKSASAGIFERRRYRVDFLEPSIIAFEFLKNPNYDRLRQVARNCFGANHLEMINRQLARRAWNELKRKKSARSDDAPFCHEEWDSVCRAYPKIQDIARLFNVRAVTRAIKRRCSPRKAVERALRTFGLCQ